MKAERDREMQGWMDEWRGQPASPAGTVRAAILRRVRRQSFYQRLWAAGEGLVAAGMAVFLMVMGARMTNPADVAFVAAFGVLLVGTLIWGWHTRRGLWRVGDDTTAAFLELSLRRCRKRMTMVRGGFVILAVEVLIFVPWFVMRSSPPSAFAWLAGVVAIVLGILLIVARRTRRDMEGLAELGSTLKDGVSK